jgi:hypothetical protein
MRFAMPQRLRNFFQGVPYKVVNPATCRDLSGRASAPYASPQVTVHPRVDGESAELPSRLLAKTGGWKKIYWFKAAALVGKS